MSADQRQMFQDTLLEDEADLEAQLAALQAALPKTSAKPKAAPRRPRRQVLARRRNRHCSCLGQWNRFVVRDW